MQFMHGVLCKVFASLFIHLCECMRESLLMESQHASQQFKSKSQSSLFQVGS
jgi:hypothetical protein